MNSFYKILPAAVLLATSVGTTDAGARTIESSHDVNISKVMRSMAPNASAFCSSPREMRMAQINARIGEKALRGRGMVEDPNPTPGFTQGPSRFFSDIDGPNGEIWYYTTTLWTRPIEHNQWWTEHILTEYKFDIYDSQMNFVGSIHDKMRYQEDEKSVPGPDNGIDILPVITQKFFNNDDKYEVVVSLAVNTTTQGLNHYRSVVYQLGGEKETTLVYDHQTFDDDNVPTIHEVEKEVDVPFKVYPNYVGDVLDASTGGEENFYFTFMGEVFADSPSTAAADDDTDTSFWDILTASHQHYETYAKAGDNGEITKVIEFDIPYLKLQGDQENFMPIISMMNDGEPYILNPYYKDYYYEPYYSPYEDSKMRENNSLVLDLYKLDGANATKVQTTEIDAPKVIADDVISTFYGVGGLRYREDIAFGKFGDSDKAYFYITRCNYKVGDKIGDYCHYVYGPDGSLVRTIFENSDNNLNVSSVDGINQKHLFVGFDDNGDYVYNFVDLIEGHGKKTIQIPAYLYLDGSDEGDLLIANTDVVPVGDSYKFAFEMRVPTVDEYDNDVMRVAWFNADGSFDRIDNINMGTNVYYAQCYVNAVALDPKLIKSDDAYEYLVLIKRGISGASSSASQEELIAAQPQSPAEPQGRTLLHLAPCEKGTLKSIGIYPGDNGGKTLAVYYTNADGHRTADFYLLPFDLNAIDDIQSGSAQSVISYDGSMLRAEGEITVYSVQGAVVARGKDALSVSGLVSGAYIAVAQGKPFKFVK